MTTRKESASPARRAIARRLTDLSTLQAPPQQAQNGFKLRERTFSTLSDLPEERTVVLDGQGRSMLRIRYAVCTQPGMEPGGFDKDNQDSWLADEFLGGSATALFGVFDGHGLDGRKVSNAIAARLPKLLAECPDFQARRYPEALRAQFAECNRAVMHTPTINCSLSGSTAVAALAQAGGRLLVANVGDSRCFLGRVDAAGAASAAPLTRDHKPDAPAEAARIRAHQGRIEPFRVDGVPVGPPRVWLATADSPGLSMSRAFGDALAATVGVTDEPDLVDVALGPADRYLLLASDGVFEFMEIDQIVRTVHERAQRGEAPQDIAQHIVATARQQWLDEEGDVVDDCTLILAFLDATPAPAPAPGAHADAGHGRRSIAAGASAHPPAAARRASQHSQGGAEPAHAPTASAAVSVVAVAPPHGSGGGGAAASPGLGQSKQPAAHRPPPYSAPQGHAETAASPSGVPLGAAGRASEAGAAPHAHAKRSQRLSM